MTQKYNIKLKNASFYLFILPKTPYLALKKITRASFLSARLKFVGIRSGTFRLGIKKPRTVTGPGLSF
jgi:hypothetical protein